MYKHQVFATRSDLTDYSKSETVVTDVFLVFADTEYAAQKLSM